MTEFWNYIKEYLTPETVTVITTVVMFLVAILKLISNVKTLNEQKAMTMNNLKTALEEQNTKEIEKAVVEVTMPIVEQINKIMPYLNTFSKILALSQENTPESRVAILNLIEQMGKEENEILVNTAKKVISSQVEEDKKRKEEQTKKLDEIIEKPVE